jgi:glycosyltransferase involved in cell wall biosynthesis
MNGGPTAVVAAGRVEYRRFRTMKYVFLTACRNEAAILDEFLTEFTAITRGAGVADRCVLYVVDDLSTDRSLEVLERYASTEGSVTLRTISVPTNFGNQGAMFYGLCRLEVGADDVLITFDCDGEDDVRQIPAIIQLSEANPGRVVFIERGRRAESLVFKVCFAGYKAMFRALTRQSVIPNNFMLIPGRLVPAIQRSPLVAVHLAYGILKLKAPSVSAVFDRRPRYGGKSSQNIFMLMSHGMVGLMVFYEIVVAKLFALLSLFGVFAVGIVGLAIALPATNTGAQRTLIWTAIAATLCAVGFMSLLVSSAVVLVFKLAVFILTESYGERRGARTLRPEGASSERDAVRSGIADKIAS